MKYMTTVGDLVLVRQEEQPAFFARIEDIWTDAKPGWYQVKFLVLQIPIEETVWILREGYINGETFTMNGRKMRIEKLSGSHEARPQFMSSDRSLERKGVTGDDKVISLFDRKKG
jgi:hypothetical protein